MITTTTTTVTTISTMSATPTFFNIAASGSTTIPDGRLIGLTRFADSSTGPIYVGDFNANTNPQIFTIDATGRLISIAPFFGFITHASNPLLIKLGAG
jgi:hypothetical protein